MANLDLTPLFRSTVGFDPLWRFFESTDRIGDAAPTWPPYNIERVGEDAYRIVLATAGFAPDDLEIVSEAGQLVVRGRAAEPEGAAYLHRGIAPRSFERRFQLADYVQVTGAKLENGLLMIDLVRELPEALRPHRIPIGGGEQVQRLDDRRVADAA